MTRPHETDPELLEGIRGAVSTGDVHAVLRIYLLGGFRVAFSTSIIPATAWRLRKARNLVELLALEPTHRLHREHLMGLLWPDADPEVAAHSFFYALHVARRTLALSRSPAPHRQPPTAALGRTNALQLRQRVLTLESPGRLWIDVEAFERAAAVARNSDEPDQYEAALALYTGDLLPEERYEDWVARPRDALRTTFLALLARVAQLYVARRAYAHAIASLERLLAMEPAHEEAHVGLMRLYALAGRRPQALRQYAQLCDALRRELDIEPEQASRQLYEDIKAGHISPAADAAPPVREAFTLAYGAPASLAPSPAKRLVEGACSPAPPRSSPGASTTVLPLVGRQQEVARLQAAWVASAAGAPHLAIIVGEAGIGKTRMVEELSIWAEQQGIASAFARCYAGEGELAYAPVIAWLRAEAIWCPLLSLDQVWLGEVARVVREVLVECPDLPLPAPLTESWQRQRLFEALARAVLKGGRPLLLRVEDLQWCDRATLEWLRFLLRFDASAPVLVLGTLRPEEVGSEHPIMPLLTELRRGQQLTEIELSPLDAADTGMLAAHVAGETIEPTLADWLYAETEGNPLFVVQMVRAGLLAQRRKSCPDGAMTASPAAALPVTVQAVISYRLAQLSPTAHEIVKLAATIGREFTFELLVQASGRDEDMLVSALEELRQRRIVREHEETGSYDFSHDKLREVAYAELSATRRRALHRRVARAVEAVHAGTLDEVSGKLAAHWEQGGQTEQAVAYLEQAGDRARALFANVEAESYYHELVMRLDELRRPLDAAHAREKLGAVLFTRARYDEALAVFTCATETYQEAGDLEGELRVAAQMGWVYTQRGTPDEGLALVQRLVELAPVDSLPARTQVTLYDTLAQLYFRRGCYNEQLAVAERATALARAIGDDALLSQVEMRRGAALVHLGRCDEALEALEGAIPLAKASGEVWDIGQALNYAGLVYLFRGEFEQDRRYIQQGLELAERIGDPALVAYMMFRRAMPAFYARQWNQARADLEQSALLFSQLDPSWLSPSPLMGLGLLDMAQGQQERGAAYLQEVIAHGARIGNPGMVWFARGALAERDLLAGHPQAAHDWLAPLLGLFAQQRGDVVMFLPLMAWTYLDLGDDPQADQWVVQTLTRAGAMGYRATVAEALRVRAMAALRRSDWPATTKALEEALALDRGIPDPYAEAKTLWVYGRLHLAKGEPEQARERLEAARAILNRLGERLYAEHVERALAQLG